MEQKQTDYRHSSFLYPWDHRYVEGISRVILCSSTVKPTPSATAVCNLHFTVTPLFGTVNRSIEGPSKLGERTLVFVIGPILATNLLSTGLIDWKAWYALLAASGPGNYF